MASRQSTNQTLYLRVVIVWFALIALAVLIFSPALRGPYIWDDNEMLTAAVRSPGGLASIWRGDQVDYLPVTSSVLWLEWRAWGDNPFGYRLINILLHGANAALLWHILKRLKIPGALVAAAILCAHPVCVETVVWVAELKNTLSLFLALLSCLFFLRAQTTGQGRGRSIALSVSILLFALALLGKISVVVFPFILLALIGWTKFRDAKTRVRAVGTVAPYFVLSLVGGLVSLWYQRHRAMALASEADFKPLTERLAIAGRALWFYLSKAIAPLNLMPIYPKWDIKPGSLVACLPSVAWFVLLIIIWRLSRANSGKIKQFSTISFWSLCFFTLTLLPVLGVTHVSYLLIAPVSDHLAYVPLIGIAVLLGFLLQMLNETISGNSLARILPALFVVAVMAFTASRYARLFAAPEKLWRMNVAKNPGAAMAWANLADSLKQLNRIDECANAFKQSVQLDPLNMNVRETYAGILNSEGKHDEAIAQYHEIIQRAPSARVYNSLGATCLANRQPDDAIAAFQAAIKLKPQDGAFYNNLGAVYGQQGHYDNAIAAFEQAVRLEPSNQSYFNNLEEAKRLKAP